MKKLLLASALTLAALTAQADDYTVQAAANSSSGGSGLPTITLAAGQTFTVSASVNDLWSAGALPRFSDANGLTGNRYASALDDSGQSVGTQIGTNFGLLSQNGFSAPYGALVGQIGSQYILLGTNFSGQAPVAGTLNLLYWDSNNGDNAGAIKVSVGVVPEPSSALLFGAGMLVLVGALRRRQA